MHLATLLKISRTSKNNQIMNNLNIEIWTYLPLFFSFFIFLSYHLAWSLKDLWKGKKKSKLQNRLYLNFFLFLLCPFECRLASGPPRFIHRGHDDSQRAALVGFLGDENDRHRLDCLLKGGTWNNNNLVVPFPL